MPISADKRVIWNMFIKEPSAQMKLSNETLVEENQSFILETDGYGILEDPHVYASFAIFNQSGFC